MSSNAARALPPGWTRRRMRFDVRTNPVKSELDLPDEAEVSFVPMDAVGELGGLRLDETRELADVYNGYTYFADGDICIAKITPCFENDKGAIAEGLTNGVAFGTTELHVLRPSPTLDARFLFYISIARDFRSYGESEMLGAGGQKRVPERFLKDWTPPLPCIKVQRRIARFLDEKIARIDALIEKKQTLLERLAERRRARITQAVTSGLDQQVKIDVEARCWSGFAPIHWEVKRLKYAFESCKNGTWGSDPDGEDVVACIRAADFDGQMGRLIKVERTMRDVDGATLKKVQLRSGDLILEKSGGGEKQLVGRSAIFDETCPSVCSNFMARCRPSEGMHPKFINYLMLAIYLGRGTFPHIKQSTGIQNLDASSFFDVRIAVPHIQEQVRIAAFLDKTLLSIDGGISNISRSIERLLEWRNGLITAAVTGQLPEFNG